MTHPRRPYSKEWLQSHAEDQWKRVCSMSDRELTESLARRLHISTEQVDAWAQELGDNARLVLRNWLFRKRQR